MGERGKEREKWEVDPPSLTTHPAPLSVYFPLVNVKEFGNARKREENLKAVEKVISQSAVLLELLSVTYAPLAKAASSSQFGMRGRN